MAPKKATYADYLQCRDKAGRLRLLAAMRAAGEFLPIPLAEDLLCLDLDVDEKLALLEGTGSRDGRAFEHFLTEHVMSPSQELAALAVRLWGTSTDHLLWFRVMTALKSPHLPQRVFYTIVDHAFRTGGARVLEIATEAEGLEEMSPAFHGLMLHRAMQWGTQSPRLKDLALSTLKEFTTHLHPDNKATPSALAYLARFHFDEVRSLLTQPVIAEPWRDFVRALLSQAEGQEKQCERLTKLLAKPPKTKLLEKVAPLWPPLWSRFQLQAEIVAETLRGWQDNDEKTVESSISYAWEFFAGIPEKTLEKALSLIDDDAAFANAVTRLGGLLAFPASDTLLAQLKTRLTATQDPAALLGALPLRLRLELTEGETRVGSKPTAFARVKFEETAVLAGTGAPKAIFTDLGSEDGAEVAGRRLFFDLAYRGQKVKTQKGSAFFDLLADAWTEPTEAKLPALAQASRQVEGVLRLCYINTLGRFKGHDQAALKLLDFTRSKEADELRSVLNAFGGIGTPRAAQELVASLTRPNITPALQLEACGILQRQDLANLQSELRSAINDLTSQGTADGGGVFDVREAIASLLDPTAMAPNPARAATPLPQGTSDQPLDTALSGKIPHYRELSSEVKRALRTSQFFHMQVTSGGSSESIDLSPVVDMQYKALELLFRESFEEACSRLINRGILQRRLDIIGYARPIPRSMDEFEAYVASLPIVRDIPFFSKFKLRKMLRAITQFRPGKRFTLDGLKAFALFFLCFGRSECRYGLNGLFPMGFASDSELYEFCKALHMHQDIRNRAAHEGFHPDASSDIDGIWRATAEIIQTLFKTRGFVEDSAQNEYSPKNRSNPVIEKKVS